MSLIGETGKKLENEESGSGTQDLQSVTGEGNTTTNPVVFIIPEGEVGGIFIQDIATNTNVSIAQQDLGSGNSGVAISLMDMTTGLDGVLYALNLTANRKYKLPDATGTIALLSDIAVQDLQSILDEGNEALQSITLFSELVKMVLDPEQAAFKVETIVGGTGALYGRTFMSFYDATGTLVINAPAVSGSRSLIFPDTGTATTRRLAVSVNGNFATTNGNITIPVGTTETASNGLNKAADDIRLGGTLTAPTNIIASPTIPLRIEASTGSEYNIFSVDNRIKVQARTTGADYSVLDSTGKFRITLGQNLVDALTLTFYAAGVSSDVITLRAINFSGTTALDLPTDSGTLALNGVNLSTKTANYALTYSDFVTITGKEVTIEMNLAGANTVTINDTTLTGVPIGAKMNIIQYGVGQTSIAVTGAAVLLSELGGTKIANRYGAVTLLKRSATEFYLIGNTTT